ncbi:hypothetical protein TeGR_g12700, partial [Tetraparma gracilis]
MEAIFARSELEDKERENPDFVMPILDVECRPELMARVKRIVDATGCEVVLSSTWRQEEPSWKAALGRFRETGIEIAGRIGGGGNKGKEILAFLTRKGKGEGG